MMVTIDRAGRVVIPKDVRDRLSLDQNSELEVTVEGDTVLLSPVRSAGRRIVEVDGWPVIESVRGISTSDADVQRWRDDVQR
ncbi:MAG: AbrB/MazE/SpoVT family DNA-binding domain-containing protein [bacterium]|nr:AbrB/MazE/SpoVT family DNA-binding domain-containing protein [bacterium]